MSIIEILNVTRNEVFKKNIITYFRFGIIMGIVFLIFLLLYFGLYFLFTKKKKYTFLIDTCQFGTIIFGGLALACFVMSGSLRLCIFLDNQIDILDKLLFYLFKFHMMIILILGLILWIIFKKRKKYDKQEIAPPIFKTAPSIQSQLLDKIIIANKLNYGEFSYEKIFDFEGGKLVVNNYNKYQHINFFIKDRSKEIYYKNADIQLRGGNFRNTCFFVEDRTEEPMKYIYDGRKVHDFESVMIVMDKMIKDTSIDFEDRIYHHHEDNFPRSIEFFNKEGSILFLIFNELGFMIKAIDGFGNTIFEDKEVLNSENIRELLRGKGVI